MFARVVLRGIAGLFVTAALLAGAGQPAFAATLTVNSTADGGDAAPGDGTCETVVSGECTLRAAIEEANALAGTDTIEFDIPPAGLQTITPLSPLPAILDFATVDGTTQPGFGGSPIIELDGSLAGASAHGLLITADNSTVRGLVINRFSGSGIQVSGGNNNRVEGNFIGTDSTGGTGRGNGGGVAITSGLNNLIGGTTEAARNVISDNGTGGVVFSTPGPSTGSVVQGNYIGTNATGDAALGNGGFGVSIFVGPGITIGGTSSEERNVISGNEVGGVSLTGADHVIEGNFIGTDVSGSVDLGNGIWGVHAGASSDSRIGGTTGTTPGGPCTGACNLISGNDRIGVKIGVAGILVQGNFIGTDVTGSVDLGNSGFGIEVSGADHIIGGTTPAARNLISGNDDVGIELDNGTGNLVQGNFIGTNAAGSGAVGNGDSNLDFFDAGVALFLRASNNTIGGTAPGAGNLISGNTRDGVTIFGSNSATDNPTGNVVQGNFIGTDVTGTAALGNSLAGVHINFNAFGNTIGGTTPGARNIISGNGTDGIQIFGSATTGNVIQGNFIGTKADGSSPLGNATNGVAVGADASGNTVGGIAAGASNTIAFNGVFFGAGVFVGSGISNGILGNSIFSNFGGLGIDLLPVGVTQNDSGDADAGPNNLQNFPVLTSAVSKSGAIKIGGSLNSAPKTDFTVEFFANSACDPSGHGEGERFLGRLTLKTDASGNTKISASFKVVVAPGEVVTATATDAANNTSEFSECTLVTAK